MDTKKTLPYDVLYLIYMQVDDYITANNFWYLDKNFYNNYMRRYNQSYKHKFTIIFNNITTFMSLLPDTNLDLESDMSVYQIITTQCLEQEDKNLLIRDTRLLFSLYKSYFIEQLADLTPLGFKVCDKMSNMLLVQGPSFINKVSVPKFTKNKVKLLPPFKDRSQNLECLTRVTRRSSHFYLQRQIEKLQLFLLTNR
jgi:hypothetical protein